MGKIIWRDIPGYEGVYQLSTRGQVRNLKTGNYLKFGKAYCLSVNNKRTSFSTLALAKMTFPDIETEWNIVPDAPSSKEGLWRDIPGYEGLYQLSTDGELRNLKTGIYRAKSPSCTLSLNGKVTSFGLGVLIRMTFPDIKTKWEIGEPPPSLPGEDWREIPGWEGSYEASNLGRIRTMRRKSGSIWRNGVVRKTHFFDRGRGPREYVNLYWFENGQRNSRNVSVAHLVCLAWHGAPEPGGKKIMVRHLDGDFLNNRSSNLE
ncbi:NUMOD4 domain-containing protein [Nocardia goodfellowii]